MSFNKLQKRIEGLAEKKEIFGLFGELSVLSWYDTCPSQYGFNNGGFDVASSGCGRERC
jgi:hypothetical protein